MDFGFDFIKIAVCKDRNQFVDFFDGLVPPFELQKERSQFFVKAVADGFSRVPDHDRVGFYVAADDTVRADDGTVANKVVVVRHMASEFRVRDIGEIPDNNVRVLDGGLDVDFLVVARNWMHRVRIRSAHGASTWRRW